MNAQLHCIVVVIQHWKVLSFDINILSPFLTKFKFYLHIEMFAHYDNKIKGVLKSEITGLPS